MNIQACRNFPFAILIVSALLSGCTGQQTRTKSSVVEYLYPGQSEKIVQPSIPVLNIPIKVGIAFVPEESSETRGRTTWSSAMGGGVHGSGMLTEANKVELLEKVAEHFRKQEFVSDIEVIPSAYLTPGGSFSNLDQIRTMYGIDVIALVSYDQVQFTDEGFLSLTYWTIVGAYVISGEKNDTNTMLDTAVYDIKSKKMLFRAPGVSRIEGSATPVNLSEELREDSIKGFEEATVDMIENLDIQLANFRKKIERNPEQVQIVHRQGSSGGGATGIFEIAIMLLVAVFATARNKFINAAINSRSHLS